MITLSAKFDDRLKQWIRTVQLQSGQRLRVIGTLNMPMLTMGEAGINVIKSRVSRGIGSDDAPMKPLAERRAIRFSKSKGHWVEYGKNSGYKYQKVKAGGQPIRDLRSPWTPDGQHMLDKLSVRSVSETQVRMDITSRDARMKARANEVRSQWWGWSHLDLGQLIAIARAIWADKVDAVRANLLGRGMGRPIWMRPWQTIAPGSNDARWADNVLIPRIQSGGRRRF